MQGDAVERNTLSAFADEHDQNSVRRFRNLFDACVDQLKLAIPLDEDVGGVDARRDGLAAQCRVSNKNRIASRRARLRSKGNRNELYEHRCDVGKAKMKIATYYRTRRGRSQPDWGESRIYAGSAGFATAS